MSDARTVKPGEAVTYAEVVEDARRRGIAYPLSVLRQSIPPGTPADRLCGASFRSICIAEDVCRCGSPLLPSARARGDGLCGPCSRGAEFRTIAVADRVNHDPGDEDR